MTYSLSLKLEGLPPMNTADGMHWRKRKKLKDYWEAYVAMKCVGLKPSEPLPLAHVTILRSSSGRTPDFENLAQGGKFILDGLVKCGVLKDDNPDVIGQPEYLSSKTKPKKGYVLVTVQELSDGV